MYEFSILYLLISLGLLVLMICVATRGQRYRRITPLSKYLTFAAIALYILSLFLPAASMNNEIGKGYILLITGFTFFWMLPLSLPTFANYLFWIVAIRLLLGKTVRFYAAEISLLLMLGSLAIVDVVGWGFLLWLCAGVLLVVACRVADSGDKRWLWGGLAVCVAILLGAWQLGESQRLEHVWQDEFSNTGVVAVNPIKGWFGINW